MVKSLIPGTAAHSKKHYQKYLQRLVRGHDALLEVRWQDNQITHVPADFDPESGQYKASNGLPFQLSGRGADPGQIAGVPVVRCLAAISCPIDDLAGVALNMEDADDYEVVTNGDGEAVKVQRLGDAATAENGDAVADGGQVVDHEYDIRPPNGAVGWAWDLTTASEYAPYALDPTDVKDAEERGKQSERDKDGMDKFMKGLLLGGGFVVGVIVILALLVKFLGSGGGGSAVPIPTISMLGLLGAALPAAVPARGGDLL